MTKIYLAIDCQWGEWNTGICSADCGDGTRTNTREKIVEEDYGGACNGTDYQSVPCKEKECTGKPIMNTNLPLQVSQLVPVHPSIQVHVPS